MGILANNEGKILRSNQTGNVLKQNYNFGNAFLGNGTDARYLSIPALVDNGKTIVDHSFEFWFYREGEYNSSDKEYIELMYAEMSEGDDLATVKVGQVINSSLVTEVSIDGSKKNLKSVSEPTGIQYYPTDTFDDDLRNWLNGRPTIGLTRLDICMSLGWNDSIRYMNGKVSVFRMYERELSESETDYNFNNSLGNETFNISNLLIEYDFNKAEILDFSEEQDGSDMRVGVRNKGTIINGHGEINDLPSGTLQEQLDYANENLFETW